MCEDGRVYKDSGPLPPTEERRYKRVGTSSRSRESLVPQNSTEVITYYERYSSTKQQMSCPRVPQPFLASSLRLGQFVEDLVLCYGSKIAMSVI